MVRQVQVYVPKAHAQLVVDVLAANRWVCGLADFEGSECTLVVFKATEKRVSGILEELEMIGVGVEYGSVDILTISSTKPFLASYNNTKGPKRRAYAISDRMTVEEVYASIDDQSHLTFDYLMNTAVAALISAVGLLTDSSVTVVASMLVSPLMGPILALTFGFLVRDRVMVRRGLRNELWGLVICLVVGAVVGLVVSPFYGPGGVQQPWADASLHSNEISSRGTPIALLSGFWVAAPSGAGVALGITGGGINALVGVAISAALLPPVVNTGMCLVLALWYRMYADTADGAAAESRRFLTISFYSACLFVMNWLLITVVAFLVFKIKRVKPPSALGPSWAPLPVRSARQPSDMSKRSNYGTVAARGPRPALRFLASLFEQPAVRGGGGERGGEPKSAQLHRAPSGATAEHGRAAMRQRDTYVGDRAGHARRDARRATDLGLFRGESSRSLDAPLLSGPGPGFRPHAGSSDTEDSLRGVGGQDPGRFSQLADGTGSVVEEGAESKLSVV